MKLGIPVVILALIAAAAAYSHFGRRPAADGNSAKAEAAPPAKPALSSVSQSAAGLAPDGAAPAKPASGNPGPVAAVPPAPSPVPAPRPAGAPVRPSEAPVRVPDERLLVVAVEGLPLGQMLYRPAGSGFFARLGGRVVLVLSGAALHGYSDVRFVLADGTPLPRGRFAGVLDRDLVIMEVPQGNWTAVDWPSSPLILPRGTQLTLRSLSFSGGAPQVSNSTGAVLSFEGTRYLVSGGGSVPGSVVVGPDRQLVGVLSLDPRRAMAEAQAGTPQPETGAGRPVVTGLAPLSEVGLQWLPKAFEQVAVASRRLAAVPARTLLLETLSGAYPSLGTVSPESEFFQLHNDFLARYNAARSRTVRNQLETQIDYARQLEGRFLSDIELIRRDEPMQYQRWLLSELEAPRAAIREELLVKRRTIELALNSLNR
jgi:hypothetical protein